jgi:hypothetical protein
MLLGPTEDRVARYLEAMTRHGRVTIRTVDLVSALRIERSEAYRITARIRTLGLFGIENDRGGTRGGRRYWRTLTARDDGRLDDTRHRIAWSRIVAWARHRRALTMARLDHIRQSAAIPRAGTGGLATAGAADRIPVAPAGTFAEAMRRYGLGPLMDTW